MRFNPYFSILSKLLGLDSVGGKAVWRNYIPDFLPFTTKEQVRLLYNYVIL